MLMTKYFFCFDFKFYKRFQNVSIHKNIDTFKINIAKLKE